MSEEVVFIEGCLPHTVLAAPYWFMADEVFPLKEHIMRSYPRCNLEDKK